MLILTRFRSATAFLLSLAWEAEATPRGIRADLALVCIFRLHERFHIALMAVCSKTWRESIKVSFSEVSIEDLKTTKCFSSFNRRTRAAQMQMTR